MIETKVIEAFHLMWGKFPEPVMLVHKSREILAVNEVCASAGGVVGNKCSEKGSPEQHKGCLANQALATQQARYSKNKSGEKEVIGYWIPVTGYPEIFVHFGIGTMIDYNKCNSNCGE